MKKVYTKPTVSVEYFALSQNIAQSCGYKDENFIGHPTHADKGMCGWDYGDGEIFWPSEPGCKSEISEDFPLGEVCYNNPNGHATIFAS